MGLRIKDVSGDGNCLFRAIADQLEGKPENHAKIRRKVVKHIEQNRSHFEPFVEDDVPFEQYVAKMRTDRTWGGHLEIQAASQAYGVNITIHQHNMPRWEVTNFPNERSIHLSYHDGDHYASVRKVTDPDTGVPSEIKLARGAARCVPDTDGDIDFPTEDETLVMESTCCKDLGLVRKTLRTVEGDVALAIDTLVQQLPPPSDVAYEEVIAYIQKLQLRQEIEFAKQASREEEKAKQSEVTAKSIADQQAHLADEEQKKIQSYYSQLLAHSTESASKPTDGHETETQPQASGAEGQPVNGTEDKDKVVQAKDQKTENPEDEKKKEEEKKKEDEEERRRQEEEATRLLIAQMLAEEEPFSNNSPSDSGKDFDNEMQDEKRRKEEEEASQRLIEQLIMDEQLGHQLTHQDKRSGTRDGGKDISDEEMARLYSQRENGTVVSPHHDDSSPDDQEDDKSGKRNDYASKRGRHKAPVPKGRKGRKTRAEEKRNEESQNNGEKKVRAKKKREITPEERLEQLRNKRDLSNKERKEKNMLEKVVIEQPQYDDGDDVDFQQDLQTPPPEFPGTGSIGI